MKQAAVAFLRSFIKAILMRFRAIHPEGAHYSFWDYQRGALAKQWHPH